MISPIKNSKTMDNVIKIKCPFDGAILTIKSVPNIETKSITCPVCKKSYAFTQYKLMTPPPPPIDIATDYPDDPFGQPKKPAAPQPPFGSETEINEEPTKEQQVIGRLVLQPSGVTYQLKLGRNVVGRKGVSSKADLQIDTEGKRNMSREHLVIDVKQEPGKGIVHYASLFKELVNDTYVNKARLAFGDCVVLNDGDLIRLPDATLKLVIYDEETQIDL
jgi:hypothetical protein